jgi:hypothetical protein
MSHQPIRQMAATAHRLGQDVDGVCWPCRYLPFGRSCSPAYGATSLDVFVVRWPVWVISGALVYD